MLARKCRYGGHCRKFYSVAQHSVWVHDHLFIPEALLIVPSENDLDTVRQLRLAALLHDAHEAYWGLGDIITPAKYLNPQLTELLKEHEARIDQCIADRFGIPVALFHHPIVKSADKLALSTEKRDLMTQQLWEENLPEPHMDDIVPLPMDEIILTFITRLLNCWTI